MSPTLLTIQLLILAGRRDPKPRAWAFVAGCALALLAYLVLLATVARQLQIAGAPQDMTERVVKLAAAAGLFLLGVRALRRAPGNGPNRVQQHIEAARPRVFVGVGIVSMAGNFSTLVLLVPATHITINSDLSTGSRAVLLGVVFLITLTPVLLPALAATVAGRSADPVLARLNGWTTRHSRQVNAGIAFFFAALLVYSALK